jgi:hypothetical protein
MKLYLIKIPPIYQQFDLESIQLFTLYKWYDGELTPTLYDPQTLQPAPKSYIVKCNNGNFAKVDCEYFMTLEEWRELKLKELEI